MGRTYVFECSKCGYRARVSGGADRGWHLAVQTVLCFECKQLHDAVTGFRVADPPPLAEPLGRQSLRSLATLRARRLPARPPAFLAALNRLPPVAARRTRWLTFPPACPDAPFHRVREWNHPDVCPRCGTLLEPSGLPFRIWD